MTITRRRQTRKMRSKLFEAKNGICHLCGGEVQEGQAWDVSHPIPLSIGGPDDESNWDVAHRKCHRVHTATKDAPTIAKMKRVRDKHTGAMRPKGNIRNAGFRQAPPQNRASRPLTKTCNRF